MTHDCKKKKGKKTYLAAIAMGRKRNLPICGGRAVPSIRGWARTGFLSIGGAVDIHQGIIGCDHASEANRKKLRRGDFHEGATLQRRRFLLGGG